MNTLNFIFSVVVIALVILMLVAVGLFYVSNGFVA